MMLARVLPQSVAKEVRALLPLWLGGVLSMLGLAFVSTTAAGNGNSTGRLDTVWVLTYLGASVALGALSVGHEHNARTLVLLLSQPASRARIFLVKQSVLAAMLLSLAGIVWTTSAVTSNAPAIVITLVVLGGLFVAPWLTMLSRNPLAGMLFTIILPGLLWLLVSGFVPHQRQLVGFWSALLGMSMIAAVMNWRTFMRLEAIEGRGADLQWSTAGAALVPARRRHPVWLLVKKELGLQQLTFAVTGVYCLAWAILALPLRADLRYVDLSGALTFAFSALLSLVIGSLASAEERHLSTAQWQLLLPMASWKQWIVKAGTALGLAMLLAVALPGLLMILWAGHVAVGPGYACVVLLLTAVSLYVSSVSSSGVRALCLSAPVSVFVVFPGIAFLSRLGWIEVTPAGVGLLAVAVALVLYFALLNHRSVDRGAWRICGQVICIAGCFAFCAAVVAVWGR